LRGIHLPRAAPSPDRHQSGGAADPGGLPGDAPWAVPRARQRWRWHGTGTGL